MSNNKELSSHESVAANSYSSSTERPKNKCAYCTRLIDTDDFLQCDQCQGIVHIKCLQHASTPGDLLGDVFFDFTCCKCCEQEPSTSANSALCSGPREKLVRQKLPWLMVITLAIYNLSIKSKGLSHHGYFHWRTHITSFIDKNWDYLFDPLVRRRKKWIGSVSGSLSHNSPEFFLSGQDVFQELGWWKLTHSNKTPKFIYKLYEQYSQKRQQLRNDKRLLDDNNHGNDSSTSTPDVEAKKMRRIDSADDLIPPNSCSRTIPYMGRKPKVAKQLNIVDVDVNKSLQQQQPMSTVQSSLMDFLAENLASEDLMFQDLPNIAPEPIVSLGKNDDFLPLIGSDTNSKNIENSLFDLSNIKQEAFESSNGNGLPPTDDIDGKLKSFYLYQEQQQQQPEQQNMQEQLLPPTVNNYDCLSENISTISTNESSNFNDYDEDEEYQPRIVQVTNFQQTDNPATENVKISPVKLGKKIKTELKSETEQSDDDEKNSSSNKLNGRLDTKSRKPNEDDEDSSSSESVSVLAPCKESLFTKRSHQRNWPWLVQKDPDQEIQEKHDEEDKALKNGQGKVVMMSEYEEKELLNKLRKIFSLETKHKIEIPSYVRRFYRKLCIREWKREHSKPLFNLDEYFGASRKTEQNPNSKSKVIDRYQLISLSTHDARTSFYARIAGSFQYELFESPYTQRVLHPFIYRNTKCFPPWLKLMCEVQYAVNGTLPTRSTIDFCYVRPNHIAAVNALLQTVFWPGIDMTECLSYPDFSVVALYKKLVVGCGFLVPDVGFNEAYISFMAVRPGWQRSGIATFMLYHLIQTCMSKDITLHVSATNPAVVLYQKFGFKIEEVILDFYEKYLPLDSKHSRHAFFLRLMR